VDGRRVAKVLPEVWPHSFKDLRKHGRTSVIVEIYAGHWASRLFYAFGKWLAQRRIAGQADMPQKPCWTRCLAGRLVPGKPKLALFR
jgi:hypothetical protein